MRILVFLFMIVAGCTNSYGQLPVVKSDTLNQNQVITIFTDSVKQVFNINYPIYLVYNYSDRSGQYYCVFAENPDSVGPRHNRFTFRIQAITLKVDDGKLSKAWEINDHILSTEKEDRSVLFWPYYSEFRDHDNDSLVDPIIVYVTLGKNALEDGRIKLIIYHKGNKIAIRHQSGTLDLERETRVDKAFYQLPSTLQETVIKKMEEMTKDDKVIFPAGWQLAMKNKKTFISERK